MKHVNTHSLGLLVAALLSVGCRQETSVPEPRSTTPTVNEEANHAHGTGPNGGVVLDLGKYHAEFTVDHPNSSCAFQFITGDRADASPLQVAAQGFSLTTKKTQTQAGQVVAPMTIKMSPVDESDGKASKFVGTDPGLGNVADFAGTIVGEIEGKPSQGEFTE